MILPGNDMKLTEIWSPGFLLSFSEDGYNVRLSPVARGLPWSPQPFKRDKDQPGKDNSHLPQHPWVQPSGSHVQDILWSKPRLMHFWLVSSPFKPSSKHESLEDFGEDWEGNDYLNLTCLCCHLPHSAVVPIFLIQPFTTNVDSLCWPWCLWKVSALGELCVSWHHPTSLGSVSIPLLHSPPLLTPPFTALEASGEFPFHQLSTVSLHCTRGGPNSCLLMEREGETYNLHKLASKLNCSLIKYHCST